MDQLKKFYKKEEKENGVEMVPTDLIEPYTISQTIKDAMGENHAAIKARPGRVLRRSTRFRQEQE